MITRLSIALSVAVAVLAGRARAIDYTNAVIAGKRASVFAVDIQKERLEVFLHDDSGRPFKSFEAIERSLQARGRRLAFGMNAGMYHRDFFSPVGLFISNGRQLAALNTNNGTGNFYLKPNGVFLVSEKGARVVESSEYPGLGEHVLLATQSGPLLVRRGRIHPAFKLSSESRVIRNGVGVPSSNVAVFAISEVPVNLYEFATLFRDVLHCPDALYLDGVISGVHFAQRQPIDKKAELGPIIGIIK